VVVMVFLLNSMDVIRYMNVAEIINNGGERELGLRDIIAVAGGVIMGIIIWFVVLKAGCQTNRIRLV
jgi:hypothetical protein